MSFISYPLAINSEGNIITVWEAKKGEGYICIGCNSEMILRKSERGLRSPHFSHKALVSNCTVESALHKGFKNLLYGKIQYAIQQKSELLMEWKCKFCRSEHRRNLIKKTNEVRKEYNLKVCRPDISLHDSNGKIIVAIEVVVTHEPEERALKFYKENNVPLIIFKLESESDVELITDDILKPSFVDVCVNEKCRFCGDYKFESSIFIIDAKCWRCKDLIKVSVGYCDDEYFGPESFTNEELNEAFKHGVVIQNRYSKTARGKYNANVCMKCKSIMGKNFLYDDYLDKVFNNRVKFKEIDGYRCMRCER